MASFTPAEKHRFLTLNYFGLSDIPSDDVNPYTDLDSFKENTVESLRWGLDTEVRKRSKMRFADRYNRVLRQEFHVELAFGDIMKELMDEEQTNSDAVDVWVKKSTFPPKF